VRSLQSSEVLIEAGQSLRFPSSKVWRTLEGGVSDKVTKCDRGEVKMCQKWRDVCRLLYGRPLI